MMSELDTRTADVGGRFEALLTRYREPSGAACRLEALVRLLVEDPLAPTSIRTPLQVIDDHLADSLVALEIPQFQGAVSVVDIGSGAGLPGLPLAISKPESNFALLESSARKCAFLERAVLETATPNVEVVHARAESWAGGLGRFDVATARAVAPLDTIAEYAAPLLRVGGTLVAWRGRRDPKGEAAAARAAFKLGMELGEVIPVAPYPSALNRNLHLIVKVLETPPGFPRRPGTASKRPLGGVTAHTVPTSASDRTRQ